MPTHNHCNWHQSGMYTSSCYLFNELGLPHLSYRNYGCGAVYPEAVMGCKVLDLGSGAGLDCFALSKLVGPDGHVIGVDMTQEQVQHDSDRL